jgi:alkanesulfonate monooxygenase SsuD/methylene tetrahydromethanopterin reductase-like flavin-dependent oxidoreductase (luciferase family)
LTKFPFCSNVILAHKKRGIRVGPIHHLFPLQTAAPLLTRPVLKFAALLLKLVRCVPVVSLASVLVTIASTAQAWMTCRDIQQYEPVSDPLIREQVQARVQSLPAFKNNQIREINSRFVIVSQDEDECRKVFRCYHLLLDVRNSAIKNVFAFRGTGTVWIMLSPIAVGSDPLHDEYSSMAFETSEYDYIAVRLPRRDGPVWIGGSSPDDLKITQQLCGPHKYK